MSPLRSVGVVSWWVCAGVWVNSLIASWVEDASLGWSVLSAAMAGLSVGMARVQERRL